MALLEQAGELQRAMGACLPLAALPLGWSCQHLPANPRLPCLPSVADPSVPEPAGLAAPRVWFPCKETQRASRWWRERQMEAWDFLGGEADPPLTSSSIKRGTTCTSVPQFPLRGLRVGVQQSTCCDKSASQHTALGFESCRTPAQTPQGHSATAESPGGEPPAAPIPSLGLSAPQFSHLELFPQRKTHLFG